jgi:DNA replication and repair protein RecF
VPIQRFTAENFRCLEKIELDVHPHFNLIHGANASGKTSLLEALAYLGRGKSFRGAPPAQLIRYGADAFVLFGRVETGGHVASLGVRNSRHGLEARVDGVNDVGTAALAEALPLQVIDPDVHNLVAGGPDERRRFLDWIAFHVEPGYLDLWRRFRRALRQRNGALKKGAPSDEMHGWNLAFVELARQLDAGRQHALHAAMASLDKIGTALLGSSVGFEYQRGWSGELSLHATLEATIERDLQLGGTQAGPHRADLKIIQDERRARKLVSRGQQKLLAAAMVLAATETAQAALQRPLLLLLDDPAAELDADSLGRLMERVVALGCQVVATSLEPEIPGFPPTPALFHVERGVLTRSP